MRAATTELGASGLIISALDEVCWLFNVRGGDVSCNPVALAYAYVDHDTAHSSLWTRPRCQRTYMKRCKRRLSGYKRLRPRVALFEGGGGGSYGLRRPIEVLRGCGGCDSRAQPY